MFFQYISGPLVGLNADTAVVEAGGIGYALTVSEHTHAALAAKLGKEERVKLYTHLAVREDGLDLYGFADESELSSFGMLISVSGVGPKAAISILSTLSPQKLAIAICQDDKKAIAKANGVGAKTAARIILELKDKLARISEELPASDSPDLFSPIPSTSSLEGEATEALLMLGYSRSEAASALKGLDIASMSLEEIVRASLKKLVR